MVMIGMLPTNAVFATGKKLNILFLGNSFTANNLLPNIVRDMANIMGDTLITDYNAPGGYTFNQHSTDINTIGKLTIGTWNYVVLQEQSQLPSFPDADVATDVYPYAKKLDSMVHALNKCGRTVFFQTWGYRNGDPSNCPSFPPLCTFSGMDSMLRLRYEIMADSNNAYLAPVGTVFKEIRNMFPGINLYDFDDKHPSAAGSYAAALTFYSLLFEVDPLTVTFDYTIPKPQALEIKQVVKLFVYDKRAMYGVGKFDPDANIVAPATGKVSVPILFDASSSVNASNYTWDFGDGGTSSLQKPSHTYTTSGKYTVRLIADNCLIKDTATQTITIDSNVGIKEAYGLNTVEIYPNPTTNWVNIEGLSTSIDLSIKNIFGINVLEIKDFNQKGLDLSSYPSGMYFLTITDKNTGLSIGKKLLKQ